MTDPTPSRRNILNDESRVRDEDFLRALKLDHRGLESVKKAVEATNWHAAREALAQYFLDRTSRRWLFDWRYRSDPVTNNWDRSHSWGTIQLTPLAERADALLDGCFVDAVGMRHDISDFARFFSKPVNFGGHRRYVTMLIWMLDLGEMFARTRDQSYARAYVDLFRDYDRVHRRRVTIFDHENPLLDETISPPWHEMYIGKAAHNMLQLIYTGLLHAAVVTVDDVFRLIKKLWYYAGQFTRFNNVRTFVHHNHHWYERGACPFVFGLMLPEFRGFDQMCKRGREVVNDHLIRDFLPDGTYREHSTSYNASTISVDLHLPWIVANANGVALVDDSNLVNVRSWHQWSSGMTRPDGILPAIGDAYDGTMINRLARGAVLLRDGRLKGFVEVLQSQVRDEAWNGCWSDRVLALDDCLLSEWEKLAQERPVFSSVVYPHGGWVALRDSWDVDAMYLALSAINPPDAKNHGHWDLLHFMVHARGKSFLADPASWIYNGYHDTERRGYLYSMESHNVLTIDGDSLLPKRAFQQVWTGDVPKCTISEWSLGEEVDFVSAFHDAFEPYRHTREVFFLKGRYCLVLDRVTNVEPLWAHTYRRFLHFDFDVEVEARNGGLLAVCENQAMTIVDCAPGSENTRLHRDGYLQIERAKLNHSKIPWVATLINNAVGSAVMASVYYPHSAADAPVVKVGLLEVQSDQGAVTPDEAVAFEIVTPEGKDIYYRSFDRSRHARFGEHATETSSLVHVGNHNRSIELTMTRNAKIPGHPR